MSGSRSIASLRYAPILRPKQGELDAWTKLSDRARNVTVPVFDIHKPDFDYEKKLHKKSLFDHLDKLIENIGKKIGVDAPLFLDLAPVVIDLSKLKKHPLEHLFDASKAIKLNAYAVARIEHMADTRAALAKINMASNGVSAARIRVTQLYDPTVQSVIDTLVRECAIKPNHSMLLIDLDHFDDSKAVLNAQVAETYLRGIKNIKDWAAVVIAGTSFPQDLSGVNRSSIDFIKRAQWELWHTLWNKRSSIPQMPAFGDYGISHPELVEVDPRVMVQTAAIRYTTENHWMIVKGVAATGKHGKGFNQTETLCGALVKRPEFCGRGFSYGDSYIDDRAKGKVSKGNATTWRKIGTNHHIEFVVDQLARTGF